MARVLLLAVADTDSSARAVQWALDNVYRSGGAARGSHARARRGARRPASRAQCSGMAPWAAERTCGRRRSPGTLAALHLAPETRAAPHSRLRRARGAGAQAEVRVRVHSTVIARAASLLPAPEACCARRFGPPGARRATPDGGCAVRWPHVRSAAAARPVRASLRVLGYRSRGAAARRQPASAASCLTCTWCWGAG